MDIKPTKTEVDYEAALQEIDHLMDAEQNTTEGDRLDVLVTLVEAYESKHYPIAAPTIGAVSLFQGSMIFSLISHVPPTLTQVST